jgi:hypothetical protein
MNALYPRVSERAGHRCEYCHAPEAVFNFPFEVEHIIPVSRNGPNDESNLALCCRSCNLFKSSHVSAEDPLTGRETALFHPRRDQWDVHFLADAETGRIEGRTPIGRATTARLQMNGSLPLAARKVWQELGLFP